MKTDKRNWIGLLAISIVSFVAFMDYTIVSTALPAIQKELKANVLELQWVVNGLFITLCACMVAGGKLGDIKGRKKATYIGAAIFLVGTLLAALSPNMYILVFSRVIQGVGVSIIFPNCTAMASNIFEEKEKGKALGLYGAITGAGLALGPIFGGMVLSYLSWRWIFLLTVPITLYGLFLMNKHVKEPEVKKSNESFDFKGIILFAVSMTTLVLALVLKETHGWFSLPTISSLIIAMVTGYLFYKNEKTCKSPIVDFEDFKSKEFILAGLAMFISGWMVSVQFFFNPLLLQNVRNETPFIAGAVMLSITLAELLSTLFAGKSVDKRGPKPAIFVSIVFVIICTLILRYVDGTLPLTVMVIGLAFYGFSWGITNVAPTASVTKSFGEKRAGLAISTIYTIGNFGASIGIAICSGIFHSAEKSTLMTRLAEKKIVLSADQMHVISSAISDPMHAKSLLTSFDAPMQRKIVPIFKKAFVDGYHSVNWVCFWVAVICLGVAYYVHRKEQQEEK